MGYHQSLYEQYRDKGFEVLGIDLFKGVEETKAFMKERGLTYPSVLASPEVLKAYGGITATPTLFLLDKDGTIVKKFAGSNADVEVELEETVLSLLGLPVPKRERVGVSGPREVFEKPLPDLPFPTLDGGTVRLSDYRGLVLLVEFWALQSQLARETLERHQHLYDQFKDKGLEILALSLESTNLEGVKAFLKTKKITFVSALATGEAIDTFGGIDFLPTVYLVDRQGALHQRFEPSNSQFYMDIEATVVDLLGLVKPGERYVPTHFDEEGNIVPGHVGKIGAEGQAQ
ncbi:MAG: TlpA family protein disulfide reductase [candidate division NC10 bacterium]|nr:TlpA family protein disulfide reductase [candidate division NC10 bacterium]